MAGDYPKREDFETKEQWIDAVMDWVYKSSPENRAPAAEPVNVPNDDVPSSDGSASFSREFTHGSESSSSSVEVFSSHVRKDVLDEVMIVIDNQEKEISALKRELEKEKALETKKRGRSDGDAGPSKRR